MNDDDSRRDRRREPEREVEPPPAPPSPKAPPSPRRIEDARERFGVAPPSPAPRPEGRPAPPPPAVVPAREPEPPAEEPPREAPPPRREPPTEPEPPPRREPPTEPEAPPEPPRREPPREAPPREEPPAREVSFDELTARARASRAVTDQQRRRYEALVERVERFVADGYDLLGFAGYPASGKTQAVKALTYLLQGFEPEAREELRRFHLPGQTAAEVFFRPCTGPNGRRWVFVDVGGELYARIRSNDWELAETSAGMLHTLHHARGIFLLLHLTPGHLNRGPSGQAGWMSPEDRMRDQEGQKAQEELEFIDMFLLFLRALAAEGGDVRKVMRLCADAGGLGEALRGYRSEAPRLEIPLAMLFTQADKLAGSDLAIGPGRYLSPTQGTVGAAPFAARHLPYLFERLLEHCRRFKLDFVHSFVEHARPGGIGETGPREPQPLWHYQGEPLSVGLLPALEFLVRHLPPPGEGLLARWLRRRQIDTRTALKLHRLLHPALWEGAEVLP